MLTAAPGSPETRRALAFHRDGLLDIFLGLTLLDAWAILRDSPGAGSGGVVVILLPLLLVAKRAITAPRLPLVSPEPRPSKSFHRAGGLPLAVAVSLLAVGAGALLASSARAAFLPHAWGLVTLLGLGLVAGAGVHLQAWRFVAYAALAFLALGLMSLGSGGVATHATPALASLMIGWGGVLLARFVTTYPRPA